MDFWNVRKMAWQQAKLQMNIHCCRCGASPLKWRQLPTSFKRQKTSWKLVEFWPNSVEQLKACIHHGLCFIQSVNTMTVQFWNVEHWLSAVHLLFLACKHSIRLSQHLYRRCVVWRHLPSVLLIPMPVSLWWQDLSCLCSWGHCRRICLGKLWPFALTSQLSLWRYFHFALTSMEHLQAIRRNCL